MRRRRSSPGTARALALAAIRETFEETGYLVGVRTRKPLRTPRGAWTEFFSHGVIPALGGVELIARAVTPPGQVRRFDTAFFRADARNVAHWVDLGLGPSDELVEIAWIPVSQADDYPIPAITRVILRELRLLVAQGRDAPIRTPYYHVCRGRWVREIL